jgi:uncharacterized circularly permuted ATP-grasp superfamily protein
MGRPIVETCSRIFRQGAKHTRVRGDDDAQVQACERDLEPVAFDEAVSSDGVARSHYAELLGALSQLDLAALRTELEEQSRADGVTFSVDGLDEPYRLDPVPRLIELDEWAPLAAGLAQRVHALDRFVADVYGERRIVAAGVVPAQAVDTCDHYEARAAELPPTPVRVGVAGLDVVRDPEGCFRVLEDNVRTPSGIAYALAAREALDTRLPAWLADGRMPFAPAVDLLARSLRAAAPEGVHDPSIVLLTDGRRNSAWYEHARLARMLEIPLVKLGDLSVRGGRLVARADGARLPVDVVYRRTDEDRLTDDGGELTDVGAALIEPLSNGTLACVNAFGAGVADDKLIHAYVEHMVRFYLDEEPLLRSVRTYDPCDEEQRAEILDRIDELVVKPRTGFGGHGVVVVPHAEPGDVRETARMIAADPGEWVAQEMVMLSTHPTVVDGRLEPRHVDLRPFGFAGDGVDVAAGGLTRVALDRGALVVNSSQRGGAKDTWVMA